MVLLTPSVLLGFFLVLDRFGIAGRLCQNGLAVKTLGTSNIKIQQIVKALHVLER